MADNDIEALLVPSTDYEYMASCIIRVFKREEVANKLSSNASTRASKINDVDKNVDELKKCYELICQA